MKSIELYSDRLSQLGCVVLIPTYNNEKTIRKVIDDVRHFCKDIIVVNDGSTDGTHSILSDMQGICLISYKDNKGKGYALNLGLKHACKSGFRYAITIDSDGQHYASDIPVFIERIEEVPDSLLIGARNLNAENMPSKNTFANKFSNFWYRVETLKKLSDTQSGYRLYPLYKIGDMKFFTTRYEFEIEIIVRAAWRGVNVENVPINVYYAPQEDRVSHFKPIMDFFRISLLNTVLVLCAMIFYYPVLFVKSLNISNMKRYIINSNDSDLTIAMSMGWGVFCGVIPFWGYQMIFAAISAHFIKLNKVVAVIFSNISIPPMIPFILYGSMVMGAWILNMDNIFTIKTISLESVGLSLKQYIVGSFVFAFVLGLIVFMISFLFISIFKRRCNG